MEDSRLDRFKFKLLLAFLMVLDHIDYFVPEEWNIVFGIASRCVACGFAYLATEGFVRTRNVKKYILRLYGFAILMLIGNYILNSVFADRGVVIRNSIIMELAIGVSILYSWKNIKNIFIRFTVLAIFFYISWYFEGGMLIPSFMLVNYLTWEDEVKRNIAYFSISLYLFFSILPYAINYNKYLILLKYNNYLFIITIPILKLYNGKVGLNNAFSKYFFYLFYPLHLWLIAAITYYTKI